MGDVDLALRHVATRHPYDIARVALPGVTSETPVAWFDSQSARQERRLDKGLMVTRPTDRVIVNNEWCIDPDADIGRRLHEYQYLLDDASRRMDAADAEARGVPVAAPAWVYSVAVMLRGPERDTSTQGVHRLSPPEAPFSGTVYAIDRVYQRTVDELLARPGRFWTVFTPFARDASTPAVTRAVHAARDRAQSREEFTDLAAALAVMAAASPRVGAMQEIIMGIVGSDFIESSLLWQKALAKGRTEGIEKGELDALHRAILTVLDARGLRVTAPQRERIAGATDRALLDAWLRAAPVAKTTGEVLRQTATAKPRKA